MRHACLATLLLILPTLAAAQTTPAGKWTSNLKYFDQNNYDRLALQLTGTTLSGKFGEDGKLEGTFINGVIDAIAKPNPQRTVKVKGRLSPDGDTITGTATIVEWYTDFIWEAHRDKSMPAAPKTHTFEPTKFEHYFSSLIPPVLHINPGDTVKTWSVDAAGSDSKGKRITSGGNPLTGPFYMEGALPGDTLVIRFNRIRLNRDTAFSGWPITSNALDPGYIEERKKLDNYNAGWKLDRVGGFAMLQKPTEKLKDYKVPLAPMLGCVGVAPRAQEQFRSGYLGGYGGNMDYNQLREGVTVYLPVFQPGALLFVGDGHAVQGAGELTGDALETSMDIEFTVDLQLGSSGPGPRFENADYLMASGIGGSLDEAFKGATTSLSRWIEKMYGLNYAEVSSVLGTSIVYDVAEVVDPRVHVVAKVPKSALAGLKPVGK